MNEVLLTVNNERIIKNISEKIHEYVNNNKYEEFNEYTIDNYKKDFIETMNRISPCGTITKSINKTGIPDEIVLLLLEQKGCFVDSIETFDNIEININSDPKHIIHIDFSVTYAEYQKRNSIEIKNNYYQEEL